MGYSELQKRAMDLARRSLERGMVTCTAFLTPEEQAELLGLHLENLVLWGGGPEAERRVAFFLPEYLTAETLEPGDYVALLHARTPFASPSHRDYLGAILGLGIQRERLGDILVDGENAWIYCLAPVAEHIRLNLDKVGRAGAQVERAALDAAPQVERRRRPVSFTVKSLRLDSVVAGGFKLSRTEAQGLIAGGAAQVNHQTELRPDRAVAAGDVISLRGRGKFDLETGGESRKGRIFVTAQVYV